MSGSKVQGHALTIKDEYIPVLLEICEIVSGGTFLAGCEKMSVFWAADTHEKLIVTDEDLLVRAIDTA